MKHSIILDEDRNIVLKLYWKNFSQEDIDSAVAYSKKHTKRRSIEESIDAYFTLINTKNPTIVDVYRLAKKYSRSIYTIKGWVSGAYRILCIAQQYNKKKKGLIDE